MALATDRPGYFPFIDIKYKCKNNYTTRKRDLREYNQHIFGCQHFAKEEIAQLEPVVEPSHEHEQMVMSTTYHQHYHRFVKYNKKRCNCKFKKTSSDEHEHRQNFEDNSNVKSKDDSSRFLTSTPSTLSSSSGTCSSVFESIWHVTTFASSSPSRPPLIIQTTNQYIFNPSLQDDLVSKSTSKVLESILPYKFENNPNQQSQIKHETLNQSSTKARTNSPIRIKHTFCDNLKDNRKFEYKKLMTTIAPSRKKQQRQIRTAPLSSNFKCQHETYPKLNCSSMLMLLVMIVKEVIRHLNSTLKRMRRKTQFLIPLLILLQLLIEAPLTQCSSPTNNNQTFGVQSSAPSVSTSIAVEAAAAVEEQPSQSISSSTVDLNSNLNSEENKRLPSSLSSISASAFTVRGGTTSHRPTGGSSITSYINHEAKIRRHPNLSYTNSGCHSCQMREQVKADNLESIKRHILLRLEMQTLPNITVTQVPRTIIENFYKNHGFQNDKRVTSSSRHNHNQRENAPSLSMASKSSINYTTFPMSDSSITNVNEDISLDGQKRAENMQGDDPNIFTNDYDQDDSEDNKDNEDDEELSKNDLEEEFYSVINSVYVFPTISRMRHNRKAEILSFKFKNNEYSTISQALLHVYIRGRDWIRDNDSDLSDNIKNNLNGDNRNIIITVHRVIRRINSTTATHTVNVTESQHKIPNGPGHWISIDITPLVQGWMRNTTTNQGIVIKTAENWMKSFIVTGDSANNKAFTVYIEMLTKDNRKRRTKRNTSMNCSESDNEERCCRYPLVVNFVEFDWTWVVAPTSFNAYFCNGECKLGFLEKYPHTHLMQLSTAPQPCCSPTKMSPLKLLYFNTENTLVMSTIPNMAVEKCSCS